MIPAHTRGQPTATSSQAAKGTVRTRPLRLFDWRPVQIVRGRGIVAIVTVIGGRNRIAALCIGMVSLAGCSEDTGMAFVQLALYEDPQGRFELMVPEDWEMAPEASEWQLFLGEPSRNEERRFDATVGLTWGRPPCDWMQVDDVVGWYVDKRSAGASYRELTRMETEIDARRAVQVEYEVTGRAESLSREMTWFTEAYGIVWQVTCTSVDMARYDDYLSTFNAIGSSFRVHGSWAPGG